FLIYGALYVFLSLSSLFIQGTLGYSVVAASVVGLPFGIILSVGSTKVGGLAGRLGPRRFLVAGPLIMAGGMLWYARIPPTSAPWLADFARPATLIPPTSTLIDVLPTIIAFGIGITLVVAPLTSTLMSSIPVARAGLGSAINNAVSRVGQPLIGALVFMAITASFYTTVAAATGSKADDPSLRATVAPLNPPPQSASPALVEAVKVASVDAFRLALLVSAGLLVVGAAANGLGLRDRDTTGRPAEATGDTSSA
ncbi:MAG: hypothetical protein M3P84_06995, partial [Chloroflexota bacterium]|nr:hypothetical protein [Chloroflexota bacterium]